MEANNHETYRQNLDRLLQEHSALTLAFLQQRGRVQDFYASDEEWAAECAHLQALEQQVSRAAASVVHYSRQRRCGARPTAVSMADS